MIALVAGELTAGNRWFQMNRCTSESLRPSIYDVVELLCGFSNHVELLPGHRRLDF
jgi:hypothetical protein